jgi:soluble lytic murein transglycosylase
MQITVDTYRWVCQRTGQEFLEAESLYDPYVNIQCGVALIHLLQGKFENTETVLAAYNAGQGRTSEWLKNPAYSQDGKTLTHIPYEETENYVRRVINTQKKYQKLYNIQ